MNVTKEHALSVIDNAIERLQTLRGEVEAEQVTVTGYTDRSGSEVIPDAAPGFMEVRRHAAVRLDWSFFPETEGANMNEEMP